MPEDERVFLGTGERDGRKQGNRLKVQEIRCICEKEYGRGDKERRKIDWKNKKIWTISVCLKKRRSMETKKKENRSEEQEIGESMCVCVCV